MQIYKNNFSFHCDAMANIAGRALGKIISKVHNYKDFLKI